MELVSNKDVVKFFKGLQLGMSLKKDMPDYAKVFQLGVMDGDLIGVSTDYVRLCKVCIPEVLSLDVNVNFDTFDGKAISTIVRALPVSGDCIIGFGNMIGNEYNTHFPLVLSLDADVKIHLCPYSEFPIEYPDWQAYIGNCDVIKSFPNVNKEWLFECIDTKEYLKINGSLYDTNVIKAGLERMDDIFTVVYLNMRARFQDQPLKEVPGISFKGTNFSYLPAPCDYKEKGKASIKEYIELELG